MPPGPYPPGPVPPGNAPVYSPGATATFPPVEPIGTRPMMTPPAPQQAPAVGGGGQVTRQRQPAPTTRYRPPAGADRRSNRYQGSTALGGSSLSTTLATPYQPSSLMTSLSSSLSPSSTDSKSSQAASSVFGAVSAIPLPDDIVTEVRFHLRNGHEVEAVRLVCERLDVGLLEATKTVRSYGDGS